VCPLLDAESETTVTAKASQWSSQACAGMAGCRLPCVRTSRTPSPAQ
jgi:hypothetical protein